MSTQAPHIRIARIYEAEILPGRERSDAVRVLVDRLWPRGVSKEKAAIDHWPKDATPSTELRKSWHDVNANHDAAHIRAFRAAYRAELAKEPAQTAMRELAAEFEGAREILLLTATRSIDLSQAPVFREVLEEALTARQG